MLIYNIIDQKWCYSLGRCMLSSYEENVTIPCLYMYDIVLNIWCFPGFIYDFDIYLPRKILEPAHDFQN